MSKAYTATATVQNSHAWQILFVLILSSLCGSMLGMS